MIFSGIQKSSLLDYPGLISCVLFTPGCNFDCFYCHNRLLLSGPHEILNPDQVWSFLKRRAGLLDAVVVTGGEPTLQPDLLETLLRLKDLGYRVKLDTNGADPETVAKVLKEKACDYFAVDYKAPAALYEKICGPGADSAKVQQTIRLLLDAGVDFEVRTTVIPQFTEENLLEMARELPVVPHWRLNRYRPPERYKPCDEKRILAKPYTQQQVDEFAEILSAVQPNMIVEKE